jgi:hypothetical protein
MSHLPSFPFLQSRDLPFYVIEEGTIHGTVMFLESPLTAATWALNFFAGYSKCK